jgi:uncharacterized membrane protein (DUF2068 family)
LRKSSSVDPRTRRAHRLLGALYILWTAFVAGLFVYEIVHRHQIRSGLLMYGTFTGAAAYGLWTIHRWGRGLALVVALGNASLGSLALLSALASRHRDSVWGPVALLVVNIAVGYYLGRSVFARD